MNRADVRKALRKRRAPDGATRLWVGLAGTLLSLAAIAMPQPPATGLMQWAAGR